MTTFINIQTEYITDAWSDASEFLSDLGTFAPPFFANEYLIEPDKKAVVEWAYNLIERTYKENFTDFDNINNFKNSFLNRFISSFPAYWNIFNGDTSNIQDTNNYGDFTFYGEQQTENNEGSPFKTPISTNKHVFKQKSDKELAEAFKYREIKIDSFLSEFNNLFQPLF